MDDIQQTRYERNILVPGFGAAGQERLARARVLVVGLGGLGSPAAFYLAAAGVGTLGLLDSEVVDISNLQRQLLHRNTDIGRPKTVSAAETIGALDPAIRLELFAERLTADTAVARIRAFDAVVEASDNFETKFMINDACLQCAKPFATAGILAMSGHAMFVKPGETACLRCALGEVPRNPPTTDVFGVLGPVPGIMGSIEALEVIRWLAGMWQPARDGSARLHSFDGDRMRLRTTRMPRRPGCRCENLREDAQL